MDQELIRRNLKYLREGYELSITELAKRLNFGKSTISEYESGKTAITADSAARIANYFDVDFADFVSCDFSEIGKISMDSEEFFDNLRVFFPIAKSDKALECEKFKRALDKHEQAFEKLRTADGNPFMVMACFQDIMSCINMYKIIGTDPACGEETLVNSIGLLLFFESRMKKVEMMLNSDYDPNVLLSQALKNSSITEYDLESIDENEKEQAMKALGKVTGEQTSQVTNELIKAIRNSAHWRDIGDYYLAMEYAWGLVNNDLSRGMNYRIGFEMLTAFANLGNSYAEAVLNIC